MQGFHGIFPDKADPVDPAINYTTRVFCGAEFSVPLPNDGTDANVPEKYRSLFTCVDAETMEVRWQVLIDGNCDLTATSYDGKLAATNQYNVEMGVHYEDMMSAERDACLFFNIARIEEAVKAGKFTTYGTSKVPVVDGTAGSEQGSADRPDWLRVRTEKPPWCKRLARWQVLHLRRQALAHHHHH